MSAGKSTPVQLIPLNVEHLEVVRNWRNQDYVREMMEFREVISIQQQLEWYQNLDQKKNRYFVFATLTDLVGLIHLKNCTNESAEAGLFVGNENYLGTGVAFYASLALLDLAFFEMKLKKVEAKVHKENINTIRYNTFFGFKQDTILNESFIRMVIDQEKYQKKRVTIVNALFDYNF